MPEPLSLGHSSPAYPPKPQPFTRHTRRSRWIWIGVAYLLASSFVLTVLMAWALARARPPAPRPFLAVGDERAWRPVRRAERALAARAAAAKKGGGGSGSGGSGGVELGGGEKASASAATKAEAATPAAPSKQQQQQRRRRRGQDAGSDQQQPQPKRADVEAGFEPVKPPPATSSGGGGGDGAAGGMPTPPQITLIWNDLRYFVPNPAAAASPAGALRRAAAGLLKRPAAAAKQQQQHGATGPSSSPAAVAPRLELLKGLSGFVRPYDLLALMGARVTFGGRAARLASGEELAGGRGQGALSVPAAG